MMSTKWRSKLGNDYDMAVITGNDAKTKRELDRLRLLPENRICADCGRGPTVWASVNLGVFLCIRCGSHHRGIGTHISKPKGCTGTYLWGPDEIEQMTSIGNEQAKRIYGGDSDNDRPGFDAPDAIWRQFLVDKYENMRFIPSQQQQQQRQPQKPLQISSQNFDFFATTANTEGSKGSLSTEPDLIVFDENNKEAFAPPPTFQAEQRENPASDDFFAQFGL